jgi:hypothetical protein
VGAGFLAVEGDDGRGCILGSDARIGEASRAEPGAIVAPETQAPRGAVLS